MDEKRIEAAAKELVNALDRCADVINGAFQFAAIHVADYTDAVKLIYGKELDALKRALAGEGEQERVTVTCDLTGEQQHFIVHLDGKVEINFARELHANRYAAGLRAEIGGKA